MSGAGPIDELTTADGLTLEARWDLPVSDPAGAVVLCHPHPLMGGSMQVPLMRTLAARLKDEGIAVLRFNFRGVGGSEGRWGGGAAEIEDVAAAVRAAEHALPEAPLGLAGWSFGAHTALRWQARADDGRPYAGVAPPTVLAGGQSLPAPAALAPARRLFVIGDRDQFTPVEDLQDYARAVEAGFEVLADCDHFFHFREIQVAEVLAGHFLSEPE